MPAFKYITVPAEVERVADWLNNRGGILIWKSINLSNPGASWTSPFRDAAGVEVTKPNWQCADVPETHITDPADVGVVIPTVAKTLRIVLRMGSQGLSIKLTDASSRNVRRWVDRIQDRNPDREVWYEFGGYDGRDCHIMVGGDPVPILKFISERRESDVNQTANG